MPRLPAPIQALIERQIRLSLTPPHDAYAPPVAHALIRFLELLPERRSAPLIRAQAALPPDATPGQRLALLAHGSPALHKLAQVLARDRRLPLDLRIELQTLESLEPRTPLSRLRPTLHRDLGDLPSRGVTLAPTPLAEASVASVVPFTWIPEGETTQRRGVFKILRPGIGPKLHQDLASLTTIGGELDSRCAEFGLPPLDYRETFEHVAETLGREVHFEIEQRHLTQARADYAETPGVWIPEVWPSLCGPHVTAMEYIDGPKVTHHANRPTGPAWAPRVVQALLATPFWSPLESPLIHGDPHAGNLIAAPDGRLALIDWSLAAPLDRPTREALTRLLLAALLHDSARLTTTLTQLATQPPHAAGLATVVNDALRTLRRGTLPGFHWLTALLDTATTRARLRLPPALLLFRKALWSIEGVTADLAGHPSLDPYLIPAFLKAFLKDWPPHPCSPPATPSLTTHLAPLDLLTLALESPATTLRLGLGWLKDLTTEAGEHSEEKPLRQPATGDTSRPANLPH